MLSLHHTRVYSAQCECCAPQDDGADDLLECEGEVAPVFAVVLLFFSVDVCIRGVSDVFILEDCLVFERYVEFVVVAGSYWARQV